MILIGQYDSPFVRRVAVALNFCDTTFERRVTSVFTEFDEILEINPLGKVPILQLENGEILFDSQIILDYLERNLPKEKRLMPSNDVDWLYVSRIEVIALGVAQKAYERAIELVRRNPEKKDPNWIERLEQQIISACSWLEALSPSPWLYGSKLTRADITCAVAFTYLKAKQERAIRSESFPKLEKHNMHCEALPEFRHSAYSATEAERSGWRPSE